MSISEWAFNKFMLVSDIRVSDSVDSYSGDFRPYLIPIDSAPLNMLRQLMANDEYNYAFEYDHEYRYTTA